MWQPYCFRQSLPSPNVEVTRGPVELATLDPAGDCIRDRAEGCILGPAEGSIPDRVAAYIQDLAAACILGPVGVFIRGRAVDCIQGRAEEFTLGRRVAKGLTKAPGVRALPAPKDQSGLSKTVLSELA